jgi:hypothetical protein
MSFEDGIGVLGNRLKVEWRMTTIGAFILASSLDISLFNSRLAEISSVTSGSLMVISGIALAVDLYRQRNRFGFFPDNEPDDIDAQPEAEIIYLRPQSDPANAESDAA